MCDLPTSQGAAVAAAINSENCIFVPTDITQPFDVENALAETKVWIQDFNMSFLLRRFSRLNLVVWMPPLTVLVLGLLSRCTTSTGTRPTALRTSTRCRWSMCAAPSM